ncbi:hypothetical protein [Hymenobacter setariae]|nr:hypothetical protein [Hymenobacter setariae]
MAQADKAPAVTKLPGEEKLSIRERAERDFLMPIRRKKMAEMTKVMASSAELESTAAPELDAVTHDAEAAEVRPEDVAVVTHAERHTALRHYSRARSTRHHSTATKAKATKRSSKTARHTKAIKATAHRTTKKVVAHKTKTKTKKATTHHTAAKKVTKTKAKRHRR